MKQVVFISFLFSFVINAQNDTISDLVRFSEIEYNSKFEKECFEDYFIKGEADYLALFLAVDSSANNNILDSIKTQYLNYLQTFQNKRFSRKPPQKKVKDIYTYIHEIYFTDYKFIALFNEVFKGGKFNCVTATAMYSLFMHDLDIPFIIRETPTHVYMIAYPGIENIYIETTDPENRVFNYDFRTKTSFVLHLVHNKIVAESTMRLEGVDAVFSKYFYSDEDIDIDQLIGIHYLNHAAYLLDEKKPKQAFKQLEKAYLFYPNEKLRFVLFTALTSIVVNADYTFKKDFEYLCRLERYYGFDVKNEHFVEEFLEATENILIAAEDVEMYKSSYNYMVSMLSDSSLINDISFVYHYKLGRYLLSESILEKGTAHIEQALTLKPENADAISLMIAAITINISSLSEIQVLELLTNSKKLHPEISDNPIFKGLLLEAYLLNIAYYVEQNNLTLALPYLEEFEETYANNGSVIVSDELIVRAYSAFAVHYFKNNKNKESMSYLQKGLNYVPDSRELNFRLKVLLGK